MASNAKETKMKRGKRDETKAKKRIVKSRPKIRRQHELLAALEDECKA